MRGLKAALYKDLKLFWGGAGLAALLLPLVLLAALVMGMGDWSAQTFVRPFPIAVRDQDETLMSRSLVSQIEDIELFSQVRRLEPHESDQMAIQEGAAAVVTIPENFFYDLYTMNSSPVTVTLNRDMELEAALFEGILGSVMDIIRADQSAALGVYQLCYGELTPELEQSLYEEVSVDLFQDALGRQKVFDQAAAASDVGGALVRRLAAAALSVLVMFFAMAAVKTLPEELHLGVLPRYKAAGQSPALFVCSKFLLAMLLTLPTVLLLVALLRPVYPGVLAVVVLLLLLGAFGPQLALAIWLDSAQAAQRWGNILLLLSLALGGCLWPRHLLPAPLPLLGRFTLPYYAMLGLEGIARGADWMEIFGLLWPVAVMGAGGLALAWLAARRSAVRSAWRSGGGTINGQNRVAWAEPGCGAVGKSGMTRLTPFGVRLTGLTGFKLWAMGGGLCGLAALMGTALLCGLACVSMQRASSAPLRLAVCDQDETQLSRQLVQRLSEQEGVSLVDACEDAARLLLSGEVEGLLIIRDGYMESISTEMLSEEMPSGEMSSEEKPSEAEEAPLHYTGAASAVSVQGAREIIAGQVAAQRSRLRAVDDAGQRMGAALTEEQVDRLFAYIDRIEQKMPPLYTVQTLQGEDAPSPFLPSPMGFAALVVLFGQLAAAAWAGGRNGRRVEWRMYSLVRGGWLSRGSDCLALSLLGAVMGLAALATADSLQPAAVAAVLAYAFCTAGLSLLLIRLTALEGRVDGLAPFLALVLCLLGGCFMDLGQLSAVLEVFSWLTPPGLAVRAAEGSQTALAVLLAEGIIWSGAGFLKPYAQ